jgi:hypothetical protein
MPGGINRAGRTRDSYSKSARRARDAARRGNVTAPYKTVNVPSFGQRYSQDVYGVPDPPGVPSDFADPRSMYARSMQSPLGSGYTATGPASTGYDPRNLASGNPASMPAGSSVPAATPGSTPTAQGGGGYGGGDVSLTGFARRYQNDPTVMETLYNNPQALSGDLLDSMGLDDNYALLAQLGETAQFLPDLAMILLGNTDTPFTDDQYINMGADILRSGMRGGSVPSMDRLLGNILGAHLGDEGGSPLAAMLQGGTAEQQVAQTLGLLRSALDYSTGSNDQLNALLNLAALRGDEFIRGMSHARNRPTRAFNEWLAARDYAGY